MSYVSTNNGLFKVIKRAIYQFQEDRATEARDMRREYTRHIITDSDIQVTIDVLQQRRRGDKDAGIPTIMGKIGYGKAQFLSAFLNGIDLKEFTKTPIALSAVEQPAFLKDVKNLTSVSPERRQALLDVIRTALPKIEGLNLKTAFVAALDRGDAADFIDFTNVADELEAE